jgi:hypothetical protein
MIDMKKKYQTRFGDPVLIYNIDAGGDKSIHGAILYKDDDRWHLSSWYSDGYRIPGVETRYDLIEVPSEKWKFYAEWEDGLGASYEVYDSKEDVMKALKYYYADKKIGARYPSSGHILKDLWIAKLEKVSIEDL